MQSTTSQDKARLDRAARLETEIAAREAAVERLRAEADARPFPPPEGDLPAVRRATRAPRPPLQRVPSRV
jgi:hypothetical protein